MKKLNGAEEFQLKNLAHYVKCVRLMDAGHKYLGETREMAARTARLLLARDLPLDLNVGGFMLGTISVWDKQKKGKTNVTFYAS